MEIFEIVVGTLGLVLTFVGVHYARRQLRDGQAPQPPSEVPAITTVAPAETATWTCAIYDYPPLSRFPDEARVPSGLLVGFAEDAFGKLGITPSFERFDYEQVYLVERLPDAVMGMFDTTIRRKKFVFSRPLYTIGLQGVCRREQGGDILADLRDGKLRVAVYYGEIGWEYLEDTLPEITRLRAAILHRGTQLATMSLLSGGHCDVVLMDELACVNFLQRENHRGEFRLAFDRPLRDYHSCIAIRRERAATLDELDREIVRIRNSRYYLNEEAEALAGLEGVVRKFH